MSNCNIGFPLYFALEFSYIVLVLDDALVGLKNSKTLLR